MMRADLPRQCILTARVNAMLSPLRAKVRETHKVAKKLHTNMAHTAF